MGTDPTEPVTAVEKERLESWALLAQLARERGAASGLPGRFPPEVEAEYQRLREELAALREREGADKIDLAAHERFRERARALIRRLGQQ